MTQPQALTASRAGQHPFGQLLTLYRSRSPGLTQSRLAELAGYNPSIVVRMCQGKKDLTGPSGRDRVVRIIQTLAEAGALERLEEANELLLAADMPPLFERQPNEARLIARLSPTPRGQRVHRTNLPSQLTTFVGRAAEIAEVRRLLGATRLLTLTGSGGCGKTRLAQRAATDAMIGYSSGVWLVELAAYTDPSHIPEIVVRALGLVATHQPPLERVLEHLRERQVLLVLDNCEHLIEAIAAFAIEVLRVCPQVSILTTSREALNVEGEIAWRVPPMQPNEAGRLFADRAAAARGGARVIADDEVVSRICQRLDGMPLAIELAAAQLGVLSVTDIAARLDDRFALLVGGRRTALPRHQTLRGLIDWSYDSLNETERIVFRRLGVFVGGWELEQVERVITDDAIRPSQVLALLTQLVRKSVVVTDERADVTRFHYLETLREYALEKMTDAERGAMLRRHAEAFMLLIDSSRPHLHGAKQPEWLARIEREYANVQAALRWCFESGGDALLGCRIVGGLFDYWYIASSRQSDAQKWFPIAKAALTDEMPPAVQAWVLMDEEWWGHGAKQRVRQCQRIQALFEAAGDLAHAAMVKSIVARAEFYENLNYPAALRLSEEAVDEARQLGADWELRFNLTMLGECLRYAQHDPARAEACYRESLKLAKVAGDTNEVARILGIYVSGFAMERLDFAESLRCCRESLALNEEAVDVQLGILCHCRIAENLFYMGELDQARAELAACSAIAEDQALTRLICVMKWILARIALRQGDLAHAQATLIDILHLRRDASNPNTFAPGTHDFVDALATVAAAQEQGLRAARLRGVADSMFALNHHYRWANHVWEYAPYIAKARADLGGVQFDAAYAEGRDMTPHEAYSYVLSAADADKS